MPSPPLWASCELMLMIRPQRRARIAGRTARLQRNTLRRLTRSISSQSVVAMSSRRETVAMPALLTRMSGSPSASRRRAKARSTSASSPTSARAAAARRPRASIWPGAAQSTLAVAVDDADIRALLRVQKRDGAAETSGRSGDNGDASVELSHARSSVDLGIAAADFLRRPVLRELELGTFDPQIGG